jgi:mono/diheme cytochrome c family protein
MQFFTTPVVRHLPERHLPMRYFALALFALSSCTTAGQPATPEPPPSEATPPAVASELLADSPARQYDDDPTAQKRGSDLFRAVCTGYCHSTNAATDTDAPYLFDCASMHGTGDAEVFAVLEAGIPDTRMQGFGGKLPEADLWRIVSYVRKSTECKEAPANGGS